MSWEPRHDYLYKDGVLLRHRIQRTEGGEWEDFVEETVEPPKQRMRMKAFPTLEDNGHITTQDGMDLRDYFAAAAMQTLIEILLSDPTIETPDDRRKAVSIAAYKQADAMMKARESD